MKTYAPKGLHGAMLRELLADLAATPADVAKYLRVTERSVWRWMADDSAPYAVLAALWHETPRGREVAALDVGNELNIHRGLSRSASAAHLAESERLARLVQISDTGAANDPMVTGPYRSGPLFFDPIPQARHLAHDDCGQHGPADHDQGFTGHLWK